MYQKKKKLLLIIAVLLLPLTLQGCLWTSSKAKQAPPLPLLMSARQIQIETESGLFINDQDAGNLLLWIEEVERVCR